MDRPERQVGARLRRANERRRVSCYAILHTPAGAATVRICDLSADGAGIEAARPPELGTKVVVEFPALLGRPTVSAIVKHVSATQRRVGLEFERGQETPAKVAEELVRSFGTAAHG